MTRALATLAAVLAPLILGVGTSSGAPAGSARAPILGVVPHAGVPQLLGVPHALGALAPSSQEDLVLQTQPCSLSSSPQPCWVMRRNTVYAIYWMPAGSTCGSITCAAYEGGVNQYFADVAHDSGLTDNVYSAATQYYDATGPISYSSSFAGSFVDTNAFPPNGCDDGIDSICLTDQQLQAEIQSVLTAKGWHGSTTTMFFVLTPDGVGSCFDSSSTQCTTSVYCAYHSGFVDSSSEPVIYGNEPFDGTITGCDGAGTPDPGFGDPNGVEIDAALNTISHEHNEAITDPWGNAWLSNGPSTNGFENGDLCAWTFGGAAGTDGVGKAYNQVINGHHYSLQQEWSNDGSTCVQHYFGVPANLGLPGVSGVAAQGKLLSMTNGIWSQSPTSFAHKWQRCAANGTGCVDVAGATAATYQLSGADVGHAIRAAVSARNAAGTSSFAASAPTAAVVPVPAATAVPVISGLAAVHKQLVTTNGTWNTSAAFAYQWLRCAADGSGCAAISGATTATYALAAADAGHTLEARVTATNLAGSTSAVSNRTTVVLGVPTATKAPRISGRARVGKKLTGSQGSWTFAPTGYRYQWLRCNRRGGSCTSIGHATRPAYKLTQRDAGHRLRLRVTATNAAGSTTATSASSPRIAH